VYINFALKPCDYNLEGIMMKKTIWLISIVLLSNFNLLYAKNQSPTFPGLDLYGNGDIKLTVPNFKWELNIKLKDFKYEEYTLNPELNGRYFRASNEKDHMLITIFMEYDPKFSNANEYRNHIWNRISRMPENIVDTSTYEKGILLMSQYTIQKNKGIEINQKHLNAYLVRDNMCIDIHIYNRG
jgi:hypothetical protein